MSQLFNRIKVGNAKRSTFDLSHHQVTTSDFGQLIPICYRDMLPNDDFVVNPRLFCRLSPLAVPTYGKIVARVHHFFVPYRILYPHWDAFITQSSSNQTIPPYLSVSTIQSQLMYDKQYNSASTSTIPRGTYCKLMSNLGLNPDTIQGLGTNTRLAAFPFLAYYRIWLDYYMDSNLNDHPTLVAAFNDMIKNGGSMNNFVAQLLKYRNCSYKKDMFTTAKLDPQDGDPSLVAVQYGSDVNPGLVVPSNSYGSLAAGIVNSEYKVANVESEDDLHSTGNIGQFTVESLRAATAAQRYSERNNYVGTKLINRILAHFGISPTPERLDMAEYLGGDSFPIQIGDITSTNSVSDPNENDYTTRGLGLQAGKGVGAARSKTCRYHAKEHGIFMSLLSIVPDTSYYQGVSRFWTKGVTGDPLDYYAPEFENLGYQEVLNREVYVPDYATQLQNYQSYNPAGVFGYVPRFSEYKFQNDVLGGDFVGTGNITNFGAYMDSWHLFRKLKYDDNNPLALNENFVSLNNANTDYDRIFQLTDNQFDHFYFNIDCDVKATRSMVGFAEPSLDSTNNQGDGNAINLPYGGTRL